MRKRYINKLAGLLENNNVDAILISPSDEMKFLTGHTVYACERFQGLIIKKDGTLFYICNLLTSDEIKSMFKNKLKVYSWFDGENFTDIVAKAFEENGLKEKNIAINSSVKGQDIIEISKKTDVTFINGNKILEELRIIKSDKEIKNLKESSKIADEVLKYLITVIQEGMTEKEIKDIMLNKFYEKGAQSSYGLISCGTNTAYPHYSDNKGIVKKQDIVILDIGCVYEDMCSDMTRTIFVGDVTKEQKIIYDIVLKANISAESMVKPNVFVPDVDFAARSVIENCGFGEYFITRLGHGIGYSVHEAPDIKKNNEIFLKEGMAFSIEPGIYIPEKFGVRIEDIVIVTKNGYEVLNKAEKGIIVVN